MELSTPSAEATSAPETVTDPTTDPAAIAAPTEAAAPVAEAKPDIAAIAKEEAKRREVELRIKEFERDAKAHRSLKETAAKDPMAALEAIGLSYEQLTDYILRNGAPQAPDPTTVLEKRLAALEAERNQSAVARGQEIIRDNINKSGDKYEHIRALNAHAEVWRRMSQAYDRDGVTPDIDDIAAQVEKDLEEHYAKPLLSIKRYAKPSNSPIATPGTPTLTQGGPSAGGVNSDDLPLDGKARLAELLRRLQ